MSKAGFAMVNSAGSRAPEKEALPDSMEHYPFDD